MGTKQGLIDPKTELSVRQQCQLLGYNRSNYYYENQPEFGEEDLEILARMDEIYTQDCTYGYRRQYEQLISEKYQIGKERVRQYMQILG